MDPKNAIPKAVLRQMARWASLGGIARRKKLTAIQRSAIARKGGLARGKAQRNGS